MRYLFTILAFIISSTSFGQYMNDIKISELDLIDWDVENKDEYEGCYFFGISEGESQYIIAIDGDLVCVQISSFDWVKLDNGHSDWRPRFENIKNCKLEGNKLTADGFSAEFVVYVNEDKVVEGLKIKNSRGWEVGTKSSKPTIKLIEGKYPETKLSILNTSELLSKSRDELQIMRNEIFARYSYKFVPLGKMDTYFQKQDWYSVFFYDVYDLISEIEKANISLIQEIEKLK